MKNYTVIAFVTLLSFFTAKAESITEPPTDFTKGKEHHGVSIGLWSEKKEYKKNERINVWILARKEQGS